MDYLKNHKKITQAEYQILRNFIVNQLKIEYDNGRPVGKALREISNLIYSNYIKDNIINKYSSYFESTYNYLMHHNYNYDSNKVDSIYNVLKKEVFEHFESTISNFKNQNIYPDLTENITFEKFVPELLKFSVYKRCYARLDNSISHLTEAINLFYEKNNYEDFTTSLLSDEPEKITLLRIQNIFKKHNEKLSFKDENKKYKTDIGIELNNDEKSLLLHLALKDRSTIPMSDKIKIFLLCQGMDDYSIFHEESNKNTLYSKISKGNDYYKSKSSLQKLVDSILHKIEPLTIPNTKQELISIKTKA